MLPTKPRKTPKEPPKKISDQDSFFIAFGVYGAVGFQLVASVVAGAWVGDWLDRRWQTAPWLLMVGLLLGCVAGFYNLFKLMNWKNQRRKTDGIDDDQGD